MVDGRTDELKCRGWGLREFLFVNQSDPGRILEQVNRKSIIHYDDSDDHDIHICPVRSMRWDGICRKRIGRQRATMGLLRFFNEGQWKEEGLRDWMSCKTKSFRKRELLICRLWYSWSKIVNSLSNVTSPSSSYNRTQHIEKLLKILLEPIQFQSHLHNGKVSIHRLILSQSAFACPPPPPLPVPDLGTLNIK